MTLAELVEAFLRAACARAAERGELPFEAWLELHPPDHVWRFDEGAGELVDFVAVAAPAYKPVDASRLEARPEATR